MHRFRLSALALTAALALSALNACATSTPRVEPGALAFHTTQMLLTPVDVRTREAFDRGHLAHAVLMENWVVPSELDSTPKDQPVVVCGEGADGKNEEMAAAALVKAGFKKVSILKGGMAAYVTLKLPTQSTEDEERGQEIMEAVRKKTPSMEEMMRREKQMKESVKNLMEKAAEKAREERRNF